MLGRVLLLFLALIAAASAALPACSWVPRYSWQFRSTVYDVAVDADGFVWLATGYGVQILEPAAGGVLRFADTKAIPGSARVLAIAGGTVYAGSGSRVYVLRRNGGTLQVIRSIDAGATVNDIVVSSYLFVATTSGIAHFDLVDPLHPVRTSVALVTSRANVASLSLAGSTLYAADGDLTVEIFSLAIPALPQRTGSIESLLSSAAVHATTGGYLLVSDSVGQNTDVFAGTSKLARIPYGSNAAASLAANSVFVAGPDRTIRALDLGTPARIAELYEQQLTPAGGTSNRIFAMARSGNFLYVAAGDIGLVVLDVSGLGPPHPLVSYADGAKTSTLVVGVKTYFSDAAGTISELTLNPIGLSLTPSSSWSGGTGTILHDQSDNSLLASNGSSAKIWSAGTQTATFTTTFNAAVKSAVFAGSGSAIVALLADGMVWRAPRDGTAPAQVPMGGAKMAFLARSVTSSIALAQITDDGKTIIRWYRNDSDLSAPTRTHTLDGIATGGLAINASDAAVFTFRGINSVSLESGNAGIYPGSNRFIPRQLQYQGTDLLVLSDRMFSLWDGAGGLQHETPLPASAVSMYSEAFPLMAIATAEGTMLLNYGAALPKPNPIFGNRFYEEAVAGGEHLHLFDDGRIDIYRTGAAPRYVTTVHASGALDIAARAGTLFTLSANLSVTAYSTSGALLAQTTINEGIDAEPLSITTAGDAVWVAIARGCLSGACQRKTLVLDPKTLAVTASMNGAVAEVSISGSRAYALFQDPDELRALDIANPLQPVLIRGQSNDASAIAAFTNGVFALKSNMVLAFDTLLTPITPFATTVSAPQRLAFDHDCLAVFGSDVGFYTPSGVSTPLPIEIPSKVRTVASRPGQLFVLTEHSIEIWTITPPSPPARRRAVR